MTKAAADDPRSAEAMYEEDTIEFQLSSEHVAGLSHAAETARGTAGAKPAGADAGYPSVSAEAANELIESDPAGMVRAPHAEYPLPDAVAAAAEAEDTEAPLFRLRTWMLAAAGVVVLALAGVVLLAWPAARQPDPPPPTPPPQIEVPEPPVTAPAAPAAQPEQPPVRFRNPFDHKEVFEFPAGTSVSDAQQAVADILLQRAQDRHAARLLRHHRASVHAATPDESVAQNSGVRSGR